MSNMPNSGSATHGVTWVMRVLLLCMAGTLAIWACAPAESGVPDPDEPAIGMPTEGTILVNTIENLALDSYWTSAGNWPALMGCMGTAEKCLAGTGGGSTGAATSPTTPTIPSPSNAFAGVHWMVNNIENLALSPAQQIQPTGPMFRPAWRRLFRA